jgi:hypothetical protein
MQGSLQLMFMVEDGWKREPLEIIEHSFKKEQLDWIGFAVDVPSADEASQHIYVEEYADFVLELAGERAWSKAQCTIPPDCYARVAMDGQAGIDAAQNMRADWVAILALEAARWTDAAAKTLRATYLHWLDNAAIRLLYQLFERDNFNPQQCAAGQRYLRALLLIAPDNKLVEDIHNYLSDLARNSRNFVASWAQRTSATIHCNKLETRQMNHYEISKDEFIANFNLAGVRKSMKHLHFPSDRALPTRVSMLMAKRDWKAPVPGKIKHEVSSWHLLRERARCEPPSYTSAWWSRIPFFINIAWL